VEKRVEMEQDPGPGETGAGEEEGADGREPDAETEAGAKDPLLALTEELERARALAAEKNDLYLRKAAEFENYRRRRDREFEEFVRSANEGLISRLLPVLENFERALNHGESGENFEAYRRGVDMIVGQFRDALKREGLEAVESVGLPFDPNLHDALMQAPSEAYEAGLVCEEVERAYRLGGRVIRHAKVIVSAGPAEPKKDGED
jgi:molecular chaperone GrpE